MCENKMYEPAMNVMRWKTDRLRHSFSILNQFGLGTMKSYFGNTIVALCKNFQQCKNGIFLYNDELKLLSTVWIEWNILRILNLFVCYFYYLLLLAIILCSLVNKSGLDMFLLNISRCIQIRRQIIHISIRETLLAIKI